MARFNMLINCVAYQNGTKLADISVEAISDYVGRPLHHAPIPLNFLGSTLHRTGTKYRAGHSDDCKAAYLLMAVTACVNSPSHCMAFPEGVCIV
jgi:hypothetical protein